MRDVIRAGLNESLARAVQAATVNGVTFAIKATASAAHGHVFGAQEAVVPVALAASAAPTAPAPTASAASALAAFSQSLARGAR